MDMNERINRINELYHKSQAEGLTDAEKEEQTKLRSEYIESFKMSLRGQLDNIDIVEKDGTIVNVGESVRKKKERQNQKDDNPIKEKKKALRNKMLSTRSNMSEGDVEKKSRLINQHLFIEDIYRNSDFILLYASYNNEADTKEIFERAKSEGKKVAFPKCELVDGVPSIDFYEIESMDDLISGYKGIMEPDVLNKPLKKVTEKAGLCIVPGLAFDKSGNRVGYGKGFYDRFIEKGMSEKFIGLGYDYQVIKKVPTEDTDKMLDMIITEERVYVCK